METAGEPQTPRDSGRRGRADYSTAVSSPSTSADRDVLQSPVAGRSAARSALAGHGSGVAARRLPSVGSLTEYSAGPRAWGLRIADKERGGERCGFIADDERRGMRPQSPCALRVPAAWGRLLRCHASSMRRHRTSSRRLASGPTASGTRPGPILGQAPSLASAHRAEKRAAGPGTRGLRRPGQGRARHAAPRNSMLGKTRLSGSGGRRAMRL